MNIPFDPNDIMIPTSLENYIERTDHIDEIFIPHVGSVTVIQAKNYDTDEGPAEMNFSHEVDYAEDSYDKDENPIA